ncbi:MAG: RsmE family RNA methyltransferase, partial [Chloroflexi bacterium]|nr:RsmE family RNA methyltransferase [Chloroflexota bacterium]
RKQIGERIIVFNGRGWEAAGEIIATNRREAIIRLSDRRELPASPGPQITLAVAVPKRDRFRWLAEKAMELGVHRLIPLKTERSVVEPGVGKLDKVRHAVIEAAKQCCEALKMSIPLLVDGIENQVGIHYSGFPDLTTSEAQVQVFDSTGLIANFGVPQDGQGDWWIVLEVESSTGRITEINSLGDEPAPYAGTSGPTPTPTPTPGVDPSFMIPIEPGIANNSKSDTGQANSLEIVGGRARAFSAPVSAVLAALELDDENISRAASQIFKWISPRAGETYTVTALLDRLLGFGRTDPESVGEGLATSLASSLPHGLTFGEALVSAGFGRVEVSSFGDLTLYVLGKRVLDRESLAESLAFALNVGATDQQMIVGSLATGIASGIGDVGVLSEIAERLAGLDRADLLTVGQLFAPALGVGAADQQTIGASLVSGLPDSGTVVEAVASSTGFGRGDISSFVESTLYGFGRGMVDGESVGESLASALGSGMGEKHSVVESLAAGAASGIGDGGTLSELVTLLAAFDRADLLTVAGSKRRIAKTTMSEWISPSEADPDAASVPVPAVYLDHLDALALADARPLALAALAVLAILFVAALVLLMLAGQRQIRLAVKASIKKLDVKIDREEKMAA